MQKMFGLNFYDDNILNLISYIEEKLKLNEKISIFTPNVDHIINLENDIKVKEKYTKGEVIIADGWPLVLIGRIKKKSIFRITGVDLMDKLLELANKNRKSVFFLGATEETLDKLAENIKFKYPQIKTINHYNGFFNKNDEVIDMINASKSSILFVGMGSPKQEIWIRDNFDRLNCNIMIAVGGAFKIYSKEVKRAPKWIQSIGMEWFYRFLKEPKRLFKRYFIKYPKFIKLALKEIV